MQLTTVLIGRRDDRHAKGGIKDFIRGSRRPAVILPVLVAALSRNRVQSQLGRAVRAQGRVDRHQARRIGIALRGEQVGRHLPPPVVAGGPDGRGVVIRPHVQVGPAEQVQTDRGRIGRGHGPFVGLGIALQMARHKMKRWRLSQQQQDVAQQVRKDEPVATPAGRNVSPQYGIAKDEQELHHVVV